MRRWFRAWRPKADPPLHHEQAESLMLAAGTRSGKPRGLLWTRVAMNEAATLIPRDGGTIALVPMTVYFEPVPGSDMESLPMAREPRQIVAVFELRRGEWRPRLPAIFNHTVQQVIDKQLV